jgi:hypothetical protein
MIDIVGQCLKEPIDPTPAIVAALADQVHMTPISWRVKSESVVIVFEQGPKLTFDRVQMLAAHHARQADQPPARHPDDTNRRDESQDKKVKKAEVTPVIHDDTPAAKIIAPAVQKLPVRTRKHAS